MILDNSKISVLIAEDNFLVSEEISRIVKTLGYQISGIAPNGEKAVNMACALRPDVILMDIKMPKMDGIQAARHIQKKCPTPVVILTAHESIDLVEKASDSGVGAYLTKPPVPEEIDRAIRIAMARHGDLVICRHLIDELQIHKQTLDEINATKDRFLSILAHDLKNPVSSLMMFSEELISDIDNLTEAQMKEYLCVFYQTTKSLNDLLQNLLFWARLQNGKLTFNPKEISLSEVSKSVITLLKPQAIKKDITLTKHINKDITAIADEHMINTVLRNLVSNAIKFTPINGTVEMLADKKDSNVIITVKDNGVGMKKDEISRLFKIDQPYTSAGTDGELGNGLGLILCKELVEKNGGKIWAESTTGKGSKFMFSLMTKKKSQIN